MALPDATTQDPATYKTNLDGTIAAHDASINDHESRVVANEAAILSLNGRPIRTDLPNPLLILTLSTGSIPTSFTTIPVNTVTQTNLIDTGAVRAHVLFKLTSSIGTGVVEFTSKMRKDSSVTVDQIYDSFYVDRATSRGVQQAFNASVPLSAGNLFDYKVGDAFSVRQTLLIYLIGYDS